MIPTYEYFLGRMSESLRKHIGEGEPDGPNRSPQIDAYNRAEHVPMGSPYCLAALLFELDALETEFGCQFNVPRTPATQVFWKESDPHLRVQVPQAGDFVIWRHETHPSNGHAGYVEKVRDDGLLETIEFNTSPGPGVVREGDGCYARVRDPKGAGEMHVLGFVRVYDSVSGEG